MKHRHRIALLSAIVLCSLLFPSCRGAQIRQLDDRVDKLETRVAVLESQVAGQAHK